jgi:hypothetical protein
VKWSDFFVSALLGQIIVTESSTSNPATHFHLTKERKKRLVWFGLVWFGLSSCFHLSYFSFIVPASFMRFSSEKKYLVCLRSLFMTESYLIFS